MWSREIYLVFFTEIVLKLNACFLFANLERLSKMPFLARSSGRGNMRMDSLTFLCNVEYLRLEKLQASSFV